MFRTIIFSVRGTTSFIKRCLIFNFKFIIPWLIIDCTFFIHLWKKIKGLLIIWIIFEIKFFPYIYIFLLPHFNLLLLMLLMWLLLLRLLWFLLRPSDYLRFLLRLNNNFLSIWWQLFFIAKLLICYLINIKIYINLNLLLLVRLLLNNVIIFILNSLLLALYLWLQRLFTLILITLYTWGSVCSVTTIYLYIISILLLKFLDLLHLLTIL